jgi:lysophospholipase L1-like esterase
MISRLPSLILATVLGLFAGPISRAAEPDPPRKILFLGNSITKHGPKAEIDWTGNWGMAASEEGKDYVHLVVAALAKSSGSTPEVLVKNIADFERAYAGYDFAAKQTEAIDFQPDLIILAIGENVPALKSDAEKKDFEEAVTGLLTNLKGDRAPVVLVRSSFWANAEKDAALRAACNTVGGTFVDIGLLGKDEANYARSERDFKHAGVANHPGDKGMAAIAAAIVNAIAPKNP